MLLACLTGAGVFHKHSIVKARWAAARKCLRPFCFDGGAAFLLDGAGYSRLAESLLAVRSGPTCFPLP